MKPNAEQWLRELHPRLARHRDLLERLLAQARADDRIRILVVGCSIGRGVADELSDIDAYMAVRPEQWSAYVSCADDLLAHLGELVDSSRNPLVRDGTSDAQVVWALFKDGVQLELVIASAPDALSAKRDWVVLHDPDGRIGELAPERLASADEVRQWAYEGWSLLLLCAKYVSRGSLWEALETLHSARTRIWRLWAAAQHVPDPQFGLTAVFDSDAGVPPGIEKTHAALDRRSLIAAAVAASELLDGLWVDAMSATAASVPALPGAASAVRAELARVETALGAPGQRER